MNKNCNIFSTYSFLLVLVCAVCFGFFIFLLPIDLLRTQSTQLRDTFAWRFILSTNGFTHSLTRSRGQPLARSITPFHFFVLVIRDCLPLSHIVAVASSSVIVSGHCSSIAMQCISNKMPKVSLTHCWGHTTNSNDWPSNIQFQFRATHYRGHDRKIE